MEAPVDLSAADAGESNMDDRTPMDVREFAMILVENVSSTFLESFEGLEREDVWAQIGPDMNPIAWMVGHCANHLDAVQGRVSRGKRFLGEGLREPFRPGVTMKRVLGKLPPFAEIVDGFLRAREAALAALAECPIERLSEMAEDAGDDSENVLEAIKRMVLHLSLHLGQILLVRKRLGKPSPRAFFPGLKPRDRQEGMQRWSEWWKGARVSFE